MEDEFGDLYDDVVVQASSAITSVVAPVSAPVVEESDSEDDDDLNIVLNEEVCVDNTNGRSQGVGVGASSGRGVGFGDGAGGLDGSGPGGSDPVVDEEDGVRAGCGGSSGFPVFKHGRPYSACFPGNANAERVFGSSVSCSSSSAYWSDKELNRRGHGYGGGSSAAPYCGGFWLPRSRTILDVNIDAFEEKRWRSPGTDVSDFFNFGLNEDAWKDYCSSLDRIRERSKTCRQRSIPVRTSSKLPQACEFGSRQEGVAEEDTAKDVILASSSGSSGKELGLPNGQAIQIEESTFERQPTMGLSQPRMLDSDVIIEIKVQGCDDNCRDLVEESDHLERTKLGLLEGKNVDLSHDKDDRLVGFPELDEESHDRKYLSHDDDSRSGADARYPHKVKDHISMDGSEAVENVEKTEEEVVVHMHDSIEDLVETASSISGKIHFSPTVSCSGSDTESSIDGFCNIPEESPSPCHPRIITTQANLRESVASDGRSPKSLSALRESSSGRRYASDENSIQERQKHQTDRIQRRISPNNYNDASPKSMHRSVSRARRCKLNDELSLPSNRYNWHHTDRVQRRTNYYNGVSLKSMHRSMSPARRCKLNEDLPASSNHCKEYFLHQTDIVPRRISRINYNDAPQKSMHQSMSPARCSKWSEELPASSNHYEENFSYKTHRDDYYDYGRQGLGIKHGDDIYANHPQRRLHRGFEDEIKLCGSGHLDEEIFDGRRLRLKNQDDRDRYWYNGEGRSEPAYSMGLAGKPDRFKARDFQLNEIYGSQLVENGDGPLLDHEILDNLGKEKYRGFIRSRYRRDFMAGSLCREMEDGYDRENPYYLTSWSHGESNISSKQWLQGRLLPRSDDMHESHLSSRFSDHRRQIMKKRGRKRGRLGIIHGLRDTEDDIVYPDDGGPLKRRKYDHQLKTWSDAHELVMKWPDDVCSFEKDSCRGTKPLRNQKIYANRYSNEDLVSNKLQFEHPRDEKMRGQISTKCVNMYGNSMYRYHHDHTVRRSSDPVDLIVGKRKILQSSETYSQGRKLYGTKRPGKSRRRDGIQADIQLTKGKNKGKRELFYRLQDAEELNNASDIEEGQIVMEDTNMRNSFKKKFVPASTALVREAHPALAGGNAAPQKGTDHTYDDGRILEAMARMERRQERFKESDRTL